MDDENSKEIDLFGNELYVVKRTKGRPAFEWTHENSLKVSMLLAMGWNNERISSTVLDPRTGKSISIPTLKRHFRSELSVRESARDQLRARQLMLAFASAEAGNVGAMRLLNQLVEQNDLMNAAAQMPGGKRSKAIEAETGYKPKKAIAKEGAIAAIEGGDDVWDDDLKPGVYNQ